MRAARSQFLAIAVSLALTTCAPMRSQFEPEIALLAQPGGARLIIANPGEQPLQIVDREYFDNSLVPSNVFVRVADGTGTVLSNQANDPDGWWTPRFLDSSVMIRDRLTVLEPSSAIERSLRLSELVAGMATKVSQPTGTCRFQVRATVDHVGGSVTSTSDWVETECLTLFGSSD